MRHSLAGATLICAAIAALGCSDVQNLTAPTGTTQVMEAAAQTIVVSLTPTAVSGVVGDSALVLAGITDAKGKAVANVGVSWAIKDTTVATVTSGGRIRMKKHGATRIVATASGDTVSAAITVAAADTPPAPLATVISLTPSTVSGKVGDTAVVAAAVTDTKGNAVSSSTILWSIKDTTVATISSNGHVHLKKVGSTRVLVSGSGDTTSAPISVAAATTSPAPAPAPDTTHKDTTKVVPPVAPVVSSGVEYGVHSDLSFDESVSQITAGMQQVVAMHAKVSRGSFLWHHIESTQGTYNWTYTDAVVNQSLAANIDPLMVVYGSPSWANGTPSSTAGSYLYVPTDSAAFATWVSQYATFMSAAATHYKGRVKKWELWNEENQHYFWKPAPNVQRYVQWYTAVAAAIQAADPSATVAVGGLAGLAAGPASDYTGEAFLRGIYTAGVTPQAVAIHPYSNYGPATTQSNQNSFSDVAVIHQIMTSNGNGSAQLWLTEWGWDNNAVGATTAASYLTQSLNLLATQYTYVSVATYFQLEDGGGYTYGLYDASGTLRAGGTAFKTFAMAQGQ